ncbi:hypothetical protein IRT45_05055 [Nocardia sp. BSTN01]|uniref:hypothetical protein n=1 Tax=Nocardia sp. BSTN01 TaxID=2783665 RepID=UPI00188FAE5B|nr:hypothetical protein [Nocardia sp. BSTN01]MBF4996522.1 hypothetical protein [Nocardia sp. BSTN01]
MENKDEKVAIWEEDRREELKFLQDSLDASHIDMDTDPLSFLAILDHFVSVQNFEELTPDQWI